MLGGVAARLARVVSKGLRKVKVKGRKRKDRLSKKKAKRDKRREACARECGCEQSCNVTKRERRRNKGTCRTGHGCFGAGVWVWDAAGGRSGVESVVPGRWVKTRARGGGARSVPGADWCVVRLRQDGAGGNWCEADLLRPRVWLAGAGVGCWVPLDLPEMGTHGLFRVRAVGPCPAVGPPPGEGCGLATGAFRFGRAAVCGVRVEGEGEPVRVTRAHPVWSADRCEWVPAGSLQEGERVQGLDGPVRVLRVEERGDEPVFNLEVDTDHSSSLL